MPWVPLRKIDGPPEPIFRRCRQIIDESAPPEEQENLLVVTQILGRLRNNEEIPMQVFGGKEKMIESPAFQEVIAETRQDAILHFFLRGRFDSVPHELEQELRQVMDLEKSQSLSEQARSCADLEYVRPQLDNGQPG